MTVPALAADETVDAQRQSPYQGLVPYSERDAEWFFGRDDWCEVISDNLRAYRITVLYGVSGVGKSSVLRAGLVRRLADKARENVAELGAPRLLPVVFSSWSLDDPVQALTSAIAGAARELNIDVGSPGSLLDALERLPERVEGPLLVVLDQLEDLVVYHDRPGDDALETIGTALRRRYPAIHFLLAIREDALADLDRFEGHVPGLLDHRLRLEPLDRRAGREAILAPLDRWNQVVAGPGENVQAEPALVEAVLDQVAAGRVSLVDGGPAGPRDGGLDAPYLQLVLARLWDEERRWWDGQESRRPRLLRLETLERLGGADRIVRTHLDNALAALPVREQDLVGRTFRYLVTPSGTKIAHAPADLADYAQVPEAELEPVLERLASDVRILRGAGDGRYEIYHDALAGPIVDWRTRWDERQRRRRERRRLLILAGIAAVLVGIALTISVLAVRARNAEHSARIGQSRALAQQALGSLGSDPVAALRLAIRAADASKTSEAESALRGALSLDLLRRTLRGHHAKVNSVAVSPSGSLFVTASDDGTIRLWDAATGRSRILKADRGAINDAAFSPGGKLLVTAGHDGTARIWNLATGGNRVLPRQRRSLNAVAFSPNGKLVVTGGDDRTARIWTTTGDQVRKLRGHTDAVESAAFSPNGKLVVTGSADATARTWSVATGRSRQLRGHTGTVYDAAFSPNGKRVVTASGDGTAIIWNPATGGTVSVLRGHGDAVNTAAFSSDGKLVVTSSDDGTARVWDSATGQTLDVLRGHHGPVSDAAFSPDGKLVVTAGKDDETVRTWSVSGVPSFQTLRSGQAVNDAAFSPDGRRVVIAGADGKARIRSIATGGTLRTLGGRGVAVESAAFSPNGKLVVTARGNVASIWGSTKGRRPFRTLRGHESAVTDAAFSPDSKRVVTASLDGTAGIWDADTGHFDSPLNSQASLVESAAFSPNGKRVVIGGSDGKVEIWEVPENRPVRRLRTLAGLGGVVQSAAFSPDGKLVVTGSDDGTAWISSAATGHRVRRLGGDSGHVESVAFGPKGEVVATVSGNVARIWDTDSGHLLYVLRGHRKAVDSVAFSRNGKLIVTASDDHTARVWPCYLCGVSPGKLLLLARARERATR